VAVEDAAAVEVGASPTVAGPNQRPKLRLVPVLTQNALEIHISAAAEDSATDTDGPIVAAGPRLRDMVMILITLITTERCYDDDPDY
jgi:hypothetical protein